MKKYDDKDKGKWDFMKLTDFINIKKLGKKNYYFFFRNICN